MIKIQHKLEEGEFERNHNVMDFSEHDLLWCFGARVKIADEKIEQRVIRIDDTVILGLATEMAYSFKKALESTGERIMVVDYYGTFDMTFEVDEKIENILIAERYQKASLVSTVEVFKNAFKQRIQEIDHDMQLNFPGIQNNPNYRALIIELKQV